MRLAKGLTAALIILVFAYHASAFSWPWSKGGVKGMVVDADDLSKELRDCEVKLEQKSITVSTNEAGIFIIKGLSSGTYSITITKEGYRSKTVTASVEPGEETDLGTIKFSKRSGPILSASAWAKETAMRVNQLFERLGLHNKKIAIAFYKLTGNSNCDLPDATIRFSTAFNSILPRHGNIVVVRDKRQAVELMQELKDQNQFRIDYDPATVAEIGRKYGANIFIMGVLVERRELYEPLINATDVQTQSYIPGFAISDICLQKGEAGCE